MRRPEYRRAQTRHRILYWHGSWRVLTEKSVLRYRTQSKTAVATMWNSAAAPQKLKTELPYDSAIPLLGIHTDELETRTQVFHTPHDSQQTKGENNPSVHPGTKGKKQHVVCTRKEGKLKSLHMEGLRGCYAKWWDRHKTTSTEEPHLHEARRTARVTERSGWRLPGAGRQMEKLSV